MDKKLFFILGFLFVMCVAAFTVGAVLNSTAAFSLSGLALTFLFGVYTVGVLDYKVAGTQISLEKKVNSLEHKNTELQESVTALFKASYLLSDAAGRVGGTSPRRKKLALEYLQPISHLLTPDIQKQVDSDIAKLAQEDKT